MEWMNYHHLLYFWLAAREGSVTRAAEKLMLRQPTVSGQIRALEAAVGAPLFERRAGKLVLTERGRLVYSYADRIFPVGQELMDRLSDRATSGPTLVRVGVAAALPKTVAAALLEPALHLEERVHVVCREDKAERLLAELTLHAFDIVLADTPIGPGDRVRAFNHHLGTTPIAIFGSPALATRYRRGFPSSLNSAPMILPTANTMMRRTLDTWFERMDIRPNVVAEFEDSALLKAIGHRGIGLFPAPVVVARDIQQQYKAKQVGELDGVSEDFYAISIERKLKNPAVIAIRDNARERLLQLGKRTPAQARGRSRRKR